MGLIVVIVYYYKSKLFRQLQSVYTDEKAFTAADVVSANFFEIGKVFVEEGVVGGELGNVI